MTPNQQVLSDEQIAEIRAEAFKRWQAMVESGRPPGDDSCVKNLARAIESATLAALAQQAKEPIGEIMRSFSDCSGLKGHLYGNLTSDTPGIVGAKLYTTPPAPQVPAPVDDRAAEIAELRAEVLAWRNQCDRLTHQVICCGVAASHPDATLTTRGAYAGKWNSGQAEEVRKLRAERDALAALAQQAQEPVAWLYVDTVGERYLCFSRPTGGGTITNLYAAPPAPQPAPVDERGAFERWLTTEAYYSHDLRRTVEGPYVNDEVDQAWDAWQARAALQSPAPQTKGGEA